jgi:hypothetical protein
MLLALFLLSRHRDARSNAVRAALTAFSTSVAPASETWQISSPVAGRKSQCEPLAEAILAKLEVGLSARRIYQDLVEENGFADSYESVKRFVRKSTEPVIRSGFGAGLASPYDFPKHF